MFSKFFVTVRPNKSVILMGLKSEASLKKVIEVFLFNDLTFKWVKIFKNGTSKGCLPQNLLGPFSNTLTQICFYCFNGFCSPFPCSLLQIYGTDHFQADNLTVTRDTFRIAWFYHQIQKLLKYKTPAVLSSVAGIFSSNSASWISHNLLG